MGGSLYLKVGGIRVHPPLGDQSNQPRLNESLMKQEFSAFTSSLVKSVRGEMFPFFLDLFLVFFVGLAIIYDLSEGRIPNWLILVGVLGGMAVNTMKGFDQLLYSLLGLGLGVGILILPFALGWLGAGDVKLLGAVGSILGVSWMPRVFFYSALAGGLLALYVICFRARGAVAFGRLWLDLKLFLVSRGGVIPGPAIGTRSCVPLGVAIGLGTLVAFYLDPEGRWAGF